eukprot:symbB.v1.2.022585.t1/scaffold1981.1/size93869/8
MFVQDVVRVLGMTEPLIFVEEIREIEIDCPGDVFALDVSEKPRFDLQCELEGIKALGLDTSPGMMGWMLLL